MKKLLLLTLAISLFACSKDSDEATPLTPTPPVTEDTRAVYNISGNWFIYDNALTGYDTFLLRLDQYTGVDTLYPHGNGSVSPIVNKLAQESGYPEFTFKMTGIDSIVFISNNFFFDEKVFTLNPDTNKNTRVIEFIGEQVSFTGSLWD